MATLDEQFDEINNLSNKLIELAKENKELEDKVKDMQEDVEFLDELRSAGVDNWEGYDEACREMWGG